MWRLPARAPLWGWRCAPLRHLRSAPRSAAPYIAVAKKSTKQVKRSNIAPKKKGDPLRPNSNLVVPSHPAGAVRDLPLTSRFDRPQSSQSGTSKSGCSGRNATVGFTTFRFGGTAATAVKHSSSCAFGGRQSGGSSRRTLANARPRGTRSDVSCPLSSAVTALGEPSGCGDGLGGTAAAPPFGRRPWLWR